MPVYHHRLNCFNQGKSQHGFTLIELLVAMTIFAMLAVAGWQVFASLNRTKEQTQIHKQTLSELQYAYLQLQKDFAQAVPWQQVTPNDAQNNVQNNSQNNVQNNTPQTNNGQANNHQATSDDVKPAFRLNANGVSFIRFADADPRYPLTPALVKVSYHLHDGRLLREQSYAIDNVSVDASVNDSIHTSANTTAVILGRNASVNELHWHAFTPKMVTVFGADVDANLPDNGTVAHSLLPKGVSVSFEYMNEPLQWQFLVGGAMDTEQAGDANVN